METELKCPKCASNNIFSGVPIEKMHNKSAQPYIEKSRCLDCGHYWPDEEITNNS